MGGSQYQGFSAVGVDGGHFRPGGWREQEYSQRAGGQDQASSG